VFAGRLQLDSPALGERVHSEVGEHFVGDSELFASVNPARLQSDHIGDPAHAR
jgi:hypothetical protein